MDGWMDGRTQGANRDKQAAQRTRGVLLRRNCASVLFPRPNASLFTRPLSLESLVSLSCLYILESGDDRLEGE